MDCIVFVAVITLSVTSVAGIVADLALKVLLTMLDAAHTCEVVLAY